MVQAIHFLLFCIPLLGTAESFEDPLKFLTEFKSSFNFEPELSKNLSGPLIAQARLPKGIAPVNYELTITTYLPDYSVPIDDVKKLTFDGNIWITFNNQIPVEEIVLNQKDLYLYCTYLIDHVGKLRQVFGIVDNYQQKYIIQTGYLPPGEHRLYIEYRGKMDVLNSGLFASKYQTADNKTRIAAVTQMEESSARRMVPCFDEPEYKATWDVNIIHPKESEAVANQKEIKTEDFNNGWKMTSFMKTPIMSSYLLAIGVFNFSRYEGHTERGMRVRVYASPLQQNGSIALKQAIECIEIFEKQFKIPIPLTKMDFVAAEELFPGAMENWGLIYFNPRVLLADDVNSVLTIAHEVAHHWFSNLVTMKWWDQLYLNEGLTTYISLEVIKQVENGKYSQDAPFVFSSSSALALKMDRQRGSHPLVQSLSHLSEITTVPPTSSYIFHITYLKGAAVFSMISAVMGKERFDTAIVNYLQKYSFQNVEQGDLFAELNKVIGENQLGPDGKRLNITHFARQWTMQMGFPVITLGESNSTHCEVVQQRYVVEGMIEDPRYANNSFEYKWDIPVWLQKDNKTTLQWLPANGKLVIPCAKEEIIILNQESNYYVTNYSIQGYQNIIKQLKDGKEVPLNFLMNVALLKVDKRIDESTFNALYSGLNEYQRTSLFQFAELFASRD